MRPVDGDTCRDLVESSGLMMLSWPLDRVLVLSCAVKGFI